MPAAINIIGQRFGRLIVLADAGIMVSKAGNPRLLARCRCDCGNEIVTGKSNLRSGNTQSCGCLFRELRDAIRIKHGYAGTRIYNAWCNMKQRCSNPSNKHYHGRGIKVCEKWDNSFPDFLNDVGLGKKGWSIERVRNDGDYEPNNICWATMVRQNRNKRNNRLLTLNGKTLTAAEWSERTGMGSSTILGRIDVQDWSVQDALTVPVD